MKTLISLMIIFYKFFIIGLFTFGGGYAMIPLFYDELTPTYLSSDSLLNFIGIAEMTPGPFAVNVATFVGNEVFFIVGGLVATLGVILPSFIILLIISKFIDKILKYKIINDIFDFLKPVVIGLVMAVAVKVFISVAFPNIMLNKFIFDFKETSLPMIGIFTVIAVLKIVLKKKFSPLLIIGSSACLGIIIYGVLAII